MKRSLWPFVWVCALLAFGAPEPLRAQAAPAPAAAASVGAAASAAGPAARSPDPLRLTIDLDGAERPAQLSVAVQIVIVMTLLTIAPSIVLLMTSFTRIVVVLGFVRTALGVPNAPSNQIIVGLALFLTFFIMGPVVDRVQKEALQPYLDGKITSTVAIDRASVPLKEFMLKQTRTRDLEYFLELGGLRADRGEGPAHAGGDPGLRDQRAADVLPDGLLSLPAIPGDRFSGFLDSDGARHDDDAAQRGLAARSSCCSSSWSTAGTSSCARWSRASRADPSSLMNPDVAIDLFKTTVLFALYTSAPFLITMMVVGLMTSLFQSVTGLQEPTLTFAPKLIAFAALGMLLAPWLLRTLAEFTVTILTRMASAGH